MEASVFHNPTAGGGQLSRKDLESRIKASGLDVQYWSTKDPDYKEALKRPAGLVIVAGGDGAVGKILLGMTDRSIPIAIWPAGTANNIARSLRLSADMFRAKRWWKDARRQSYYLGKAAGPWGETRFVEGVGSGALASAMLEKPDKSLSKREKIAFGRRALIERIEKALSEDHRFSVNQRLFAEPLIAIEVLNIPWTSSGLELAPGADPGDRTLSVVSIASSQAESLVEQIKAPQAPVFDPVVIRGETIVLRLVTGPVRIDDQIVAENGDDMPIIIEKEAAPLQILVPRDG